MDTEEWGGRSPQNAETDTKAYHIGRVAHQVTIVLNHRSPISGFAQLFVLDQYHCLQLEGSS